MWFSFYFSVGCCTFRVPSNHFLKHPSRIMMYRNHIFYFSQELRLSFNYINPGVGDFRRKKNCDKVLWEMPTLNLAVKGAFFLSFFFFLICLPHRPIAQKCSEVTAMSSRKDISPITSREKISQVWERRIPMYMHTYSFIYSSSKPTLTIPVVWTLSFIRHFAGSHWNKLMAVEVDTFFLSHNRWTGRKLQLISGAGTPK